VPELSIKISFYIYTYKYIYRVIPQHVAEGGGDGAGRVHGRRAHPLIDNRSQCLNYQLKSVSIYLHTNIYISGYPAARRRRWTWWRGPCSWARSSSAWWWSQPVPELSITIGVYIYIYRVRLRGAISFEWVVNIKGGRVHRRWTHPLNDDRSQCLNYQLKSVSIYIHTNIYIRLTRSTSPKVAVMARAVFMGAKLIRLMMIAASAW